MGSIRSSAVRASRSAFAWDEPSFIEDDRGVAVALRHIQDRRAAVGVPGPHRWNGAILFGIAAILVAAFIALIISIPHLLVYVLLALLPMGGILYASTILIGREKARRTLPMIVATSLATGRCGCCVQPLHGLPIQDDGCVSCASCGASWHADRWRTAKVGTDVAERAVKFKGMPPERNGCDDRGVALDPGAIPKQLPLNTPAGERMSPNLIAQRREHRARAQADMDHQRQLFVLVIAGMVAATLIGASSVTIIISVVKEGEWSMGSLAAYGGPLYLVGVNMLFERSRRLRDAARRHGLCPNCVTYIDPAARIEFDGCVACEQCGRAWKVADVKQPPSPPTSAMAREPWICGDIARQGRAHE